MVSRRKQLKPSGTEEGRTEPTVATGSCSDTGSPLVTLPAEVQCIITSYLVQSRDLNHLCCTCKALSAVVLPTLYHTIELKVPLRWRRLPSLENLLASSSEGLKYTRCLRIVTRQYPQKDNSYLNLDKAPETDHDFGHGGEAEADDTELEEGEEDDDDDDGIFRVYKPDGLASNTLNAFIRVLISKLPSQQLHTFWWEHACSLSAFTLSILIKHQGASIHTLNFREYTRKWGKVALAKLKMRSLISLGMASLGILDSLAIELLARNHHNLRHLRLGSEVDLVTEYAENGHMDPGEIARFNLTETFSETMQKKVAALKEGSAPVLQLESLSLVGLDLSAFTSGLVEPIVDFNSLSILTLESCAGLEAAFSLLMRARGGSRKAESALRLHTLAIRHEDASNEFLQVLQHFLLSLRPLVQLHVLLEGEYTGIIVLGRMLRVHGKCLRSLIWDERTGPRRDVLVDTTTAPDDHRYLEIVAKHCPGLRALGISLDWTDITGSKGHHKKIATSFSHLSQLQTLNIRNLPMTPTSTFLLPNDYMVEGLATMLLNIVTKNTRTDQPLALKTVAIGASTYGTARVGMGHYTPNNTSAFFQLRIYHINYDCRYRDSLSPKLHLIARGTPADARGNAENLDIFKLYWLDGLLPDPGRYH